MKHQVFHKTNTGFVCLWFLAQATSRNTLPVSSVEQRLLELNRQSAAARGRLLELIEQQKQNVSAKVSPSDSPIPPSAFSPQSVGMASQPDMYLSICVITCHKKKSLYHIILSWSRKS